MPQPSTNDDTTRRTYWAEQLELGYKMVEQMMAFPVVELGEPFASIPAAAKAAGVTMLFSESKIAGDLDRIFYIRESLVDDVIGIGRDMNERGWVVKIEEGYRSLEMQRELGRKPAVFDAILRKCIWENYGKIPPVDFVFRRASVMVANLPKVGTHMSGSAIDISVFDRNNGREIGRGGPYLEMSERTPMRSPFITESELQNRLEITAIMESRGFMHFPFEFWHYNKGDAGAHILTGNPSPAPFGPVNWNRRTNQVTSVASPMDPLNPLSVIESEIKAAMARVK